MESSERAFLKTPIGYLEINGSSKGISSINFLRFPVRIKYIPHHLKDCIHQLNEYFDGNRREFDLPLDLEGSPFQLKVWNEIRRIPFGHTITYGELAKRVGEPGATRAVGGANGQNPVPVIIPCHRVIGTDGRLTGYGGGLKKKKWLLEHENALKQMDLFSVSKRKR
jgi:methylated-DNA-[protein]-cysteine S-methyltransferase